MDEDWQRHLDHANRLCAKYQTDSYTRLKHFVNSLQHKSKAYSDYQSLTKDLSLTWTEIFQASNNRYHSPTKITRLTRQLKALTIRKIKNQKASVEDASSNFCPKLNDRHVWLIKPTELTMDLVMFNWKPFKNLGHDMHTPKMESNLWFQDH